MLHAVRPALVTLVTPRNTNARSALGEGSRRAVRPRSTGVGPGVAALAVCRTHRRARALERGAPAGQCGIRARGVLAVRRGLATFALLYSTQPLLPDLARQFHVTAGRAALSVSLATLGSASRCCSSARSPRRSAGPRSSTPRSSSPVPSVSPRPRRRPGRCCLVLRGLQGVVLLGLSAVALAYLKEEVHASAHARASGLYIGGTAIGGMAGRLSRVGRGRDPLAGAVPLSVSSPRSARSRSGSSCRRRGTSIRSWPGRGMSSRSTEVGQRGTVARGIRRGIPGMGAFVAVYNAVGFRLVAAPYRLSIGQASPSSPPYALGSARLDVCRRFADRHGRTRSCRVSGVMLAGVLLTPVASLWGSPRRSGCRPPAGSGAHGVVSGPRQREAQSLGGWSGVGALSVRLLPRLVGLRHPPARRRGPAGLGAVTGSRRVSSPWRSRSRVAGGAAGPEGGRAAHAGERELRGPVQLPGDRAKEKLPCPAGH